MTRHHRIHWQPGVEEIVAREVAKALDPIAALAEEWERLARDNREAAIRDADIERDWIASDYEIKASALRAALADPQEKP